MSNKQNVHKTLTFCFCHNFFPKSWNKHKYPKNILAYLLENYPDKPWSFRDLSSNPNITLALIEKYPDKDWYWGCSGISYNRNITLEWIEKYPNKPWDLNSISINPSITLEIIEYFKNKIDFEGLSRNTFEYNNKKVKIISKKIKLFHYLSFSKIIYDIKRFLVTTF